MLFKKSNTGAAVAAAEADEYATIPATRPERIEHRATGPHLAGRALGSGATVELCLPGDVFIPGRLSLETQNEPRGWHLLIVIADGEPVERALLPLPPAARLRWSERRVKRDDQAA